MLSHLAEELTELKPAIWDESFRAVKALFVDYAAVRSTNGQIIDGEHDIVGLRFVFCDRLTPNHHITVRFSIRPRSSLGAQKPL